MMLEILNIISCKLNITDFKNICGPICNNKKYGFTDYITINSACHHKNSSSQNVHGDRHPTGLNVFIHLQL